MNPTVAPWRAAIGNAVRALFGERPASAWQAGDDLRAAYARRIGVPVIDRPTVDTPRPINRAARRAAGKRGPLTAAQLAAHPQPTYRKPVAR